MKNKRVLIVDDVYENRILLRLIIEKNTPFEILEAANGFEAIEIIRQTPPHIILLDVMMPDMDGFQLAEQLQKDKEAENIPILFITALNQEDDIIRAFDAGAVDYIIKPFRAKEVLHRLMTHLKLHDLINNLDELVKEKTTALEELNIGLVMALERANSYNDDDTGNHIKRVCHYSKIIAESLELEHKVIDDIFTYASLHDIGKVGIPDSILKKPGRLTDEEMQVMRRHSYIGYKMIENIAISQIAKNITLFHHEKYDGKGYPRRLKGEEIPIEARIVALADVFDALSNERVYKRAFTLPETDEIILELDGTHFDPRIIDIYRKRKKDFFDVHSHFKD